MRYPSFFADVPPLVMKDRLAEFLGAAEDGLVEYRYVDAVKLAGHSCPTVATAWVLTTRALKALYGDDVPERGEVRVQMRDPRAAGVTGVVANVASLLTGAAADTGFKGIAGRFDRRDLLSYGEPLPMEVRFTRIDTGSAVDAGANLATIPADPELAPSCGDARRRPPRKTSRRVSESFGRTGCAECSSTPRTRRSLQLAASLDRDALCSNGPTRVCSRVAPARSSR